MRDHSRDIIAAVASLEEAGKIYTRAENMTHPRAHEIARIGRTLEHVSRILSGYQDHEADIRALLG